MSKKTWLWIIFGALFPPLFLFPLIYHFFYRPLKDGVIGGGHLRFYIWSFFVLSFSVLSSLPLRDLASSFLKLQDPGTAQLFLFSSLFLGIISIAMLFISLRNETDKNQFLTVKKFKPDKLFALCLLMTFAPLLLPLLRKNFSIDQIAHPHLYAIAIAFIGKSYLAVLAGFLTVTITTAVLEESFFRGALLRDYGELGLFGRRALLALAALYFAICHLPISFISPLIFAFYMNRIRLAYNNLLPSIILHALWNASVIVALFILMNNAGIHNSLRTRKEEMDEVYKIWTTRSVSVTKKYFQIQRSESGNIYRAKGQNLSLLTLVDSANNEKITSLIVKLHSPTSEEEIRESFISDDWITSSFKKKNRKDETIIQNLTCSKKIDACFKAKERNVSIIFLGSYDSEMEIF